MIFNIITVTISVASILISSISAYSQRKQSKESQKISLESIYYKEIYWNYLVIKIPDARDYVKFANSTKKVIDTEKIEEVLINMRRDSLFFKFTDVNFYNNICSKLQDVENEYVSADKMTSEKYIEFQEGIDNILNEIYKIILDKYLGKK